MAAAALKVDRLRDVEEIEREDLPMKDLHGQQDINLWGSRLRFFDEPVAHADDGLDLAAGRAELAAQAADVHIDRSRLDLAVESPHALEQPVARQHAVAVFDEETQQLEFALGQPDWRAGHAHRDGIEIDREAAALIAERLIAWRICGGRRSTARTRATSSRRLNGFVT